MLQLVVSTSSNSNKSESRGRWPRSPAPTPLSGYLDLGLAAGHMHVCLDVALLLRASGQHPLAVSLGVCLTPPARQGSMPTHLVRAWEVRVLGRSGCGRALQARGADSFIGSVCWSIKARLAAGEPRAPVLGVSVRVRCSPAAAP